MDWARWRVWCLHLLNNTLLIYTGHQLTEMQQLPWLWFPGRISLGGFWKRDVLHPAEQMTSVDVVRNRCGSSCMVDVLSNLGLNLSMPRLQRPARVEEREWISVCFSCHDNRSCSVRQNCPDRGSSCLYLYTSFQCWGLDFQIQLSILTRPRVC